VGRHSNGFLDRPFPWRWMIVLLVLAVGAATSLAVARARSGNDDVAGGGCSGDAVRVRVGADPAVAPWLTELANTYSALRRPVSGGCAEATVDTVDPASLAGRVKDVDAWVAESSTTLGLTRALVRTEPAALAVPATSIASSPIVLAMPRDAMQQLAAALGNREAKFSDLVVLAQRPEGWGQLATGQPSWGPIRFSTLDPGRTTIGASLVVSAVAALLRRPANDVGATAFGQVDAQNGLFGFVRTLVGSPTSAQELLDKAAAAGSTAELLRSVGIVALYEKDIWAYNGRSPVVRLQATYPVAGQLAADFPYAVLNGAWVSPGARAAAADFRQWLLSGSTQRKLAGYGLRGPDGTAGPALTDPALGLSAAPQKPAEPTTPDGVGAAQAAWQLITRPVSTLELIDVSGSMAEPVPGTGKTKLDLAREAGITSLGFAENGDSIGLWEFSQRISGSKDHRQLVGLGPAGDKVGPFPDRRTAVAAGYKAMRPLGGTGLYDSVVAAYAAANASYRPDAVNTVLLLSDGQNEDAGSIDLPTTLARLKSMFRADRPVHLVTIAYGAEADRGSLAQLARATGGRSFDAVDPRRVSQVFIAAVTYLPGAR
jgi:Ca-activated chloride channel homolog